MKSFAGLIALVATCGSLLGQGIINNGAYIVMTGNAQIYVDGAATGDYTSQANGVITPSATGVVSIEGDWFNNAGNTGFTADAGTVQLVDANQSIGGTTTTTFYNLTLLGSGTKTLNVNTIVGGGVTTTGVLSLGTRPLMLNTYRLTLTNPAAGAVTSTTGHIISETNAAANSSIVQWNLGAVTGARTIPFGTTGGVLIPLTFNKTSAGASNINVATRPTVASDNLPWSTGVTHMFDPNLAQDGSDEAVIDRWWDITTTGATTADVTFSYAGAENTMMIPYNTGNVGAQYWDAAWLPNNSNIGSAPAVLAGVGNVTASGLSFLAGTFTPMVLSSLAAPLPVELVTFTTECNNDAVLVSWITASETNNNFFTIERSEDGITYNAIGTVDGNGTSTQMHSYNFTDVQPVNGFAYYRLKQTDFNGQTSNSPIAIQTACGTPRETISSFGNGNGITVDIYSPSESDYTITVFDAQGKLIRSNGVTTGEGSNRYEILDVVPANGIYLITVSDASGMQHSNKICFQK